MERRTPREGIQCFSHGTAQCSEWLLSKVLGREWHRPLAHRPTLSSHQAPICSFFRYHPMICLYFLPLLIPIESSNLAWNLFPWGSGSFPKSRLDTRSQHLLDHTVRYLLSGPETLKGSWSYSPQVIQKRLSGEAMPWVSPAPARIPDTILGVRFREVNTFYPSVKDRANTTNEQIRSFHKILNS